MSVHCALHCSVAAVSSSRLRSARSDDPLTSRRARETFTAQAIAGTHEQVDTYAYLDEEEFETHMLEFPVGRHVVTGELAKYLWEDLVHQGPYNSSISPADVQEEIKNLQGPYDLPMTSNRHLASVGSLLALSNQLSQSSPSCINVIDQTFTLDPTQIPEQLRVPQSVRGIKFWPTPDRWLQAVHEQQGAQQRNFYSNNFTDAFSLNFPPSRVAASVLPCNEFELIGGSISLGDDGCIVLDGRGENDLPDQEQRMHGVTIEGGSVVCCGTRCEAFFTNVTFINCSVVAVHGATVTLQDCSFSWEGATATSGIGVFARGPNTTVQVKGGIIRGGKQGAAITEGAAFIADMWKIRKVVSSHSPGATLLMRTCSFDNIDTSMRSCHALLVQVQSLVEVIERTFSVCATACRAKACLQRCQVSETSEDGVARLAEKKTANAEPSSQEGETESTGADGDDEKIVQSPVQVTECIVSEESSITGERALG